MTKIIYGFGHYSRVGKDTVCDKLVKACEENGIPAIKRAFAKPVKDITYELYGWAGMHPGHAYERPEMEHLRNVRLPKLRNERWPEGPTPVELWVQVGTHAIREQVYEDSFVDLALEAPFHGVVFISDIRFENEIDAIRVKGGRAYKVLRPGVEPRNTKADQALLNYTDWNGVIINDSMDTLDMFARDLVHLEILPRWQSETIRRAA